MSAVSFFVLKELFATRLFSKRACIVAKMNKEAFPSLEKLSKFKDQKVRGQYIGGNVSQNKPFQKQGTIQLLLTSMGALSL